MQSIVGRPRKSWEVSKARAFPAVLPGHAPSGRQCKVPDPFPSKSRSPTCSRQHVQSAVAASSYCRQGPAAPAGCDPLSPAACSRPASPVDKSIVASRLPPSSSSSRQWITVSSRQIFANPNQITLICRRNFMCSQTFSPAVRRNGLSGDRVLCSWSCFGSGSS